MYLFVGSCTQYVLWWVSGGQVDNFGSQFPLSNMWVLGIGLTSSGLGGKCLNPQSHVTGHVYVYM